MIKFHSTNDLIDSLCRRLTKGVDVGIRGSTKVDGPPNIIINIDRMGFTSPLIGFEKGAIV